jgi:hypothetical protein
LILGDAEHTRYRFLIDNLNLATLSVGSEVSISGMFCVTKDQMDGKWLGTYRDYDYTLWKWKCKEPEKPKDDGKKDDKGPKDDGPKEKEQV